MLVIKRERERERERILSFERREKILMKYASIHHYLLPYASAQILGSLIMFMIIS